MTITQMTSADGWFARYTMNDNHEQLVPVATFVTRVDDNGVPSILGVVPVDGILDNAEDIKGFKGYFYNRCQMASSTEIVVEATR